MLRPIPDTTIFDLRLSRRGRRLNNLCAVLCSPQERAAFKGDEEAFMSRFGLTGAEKVNGLGITPVASGAVGQRTGHDTQALATLYGPA